MMTTRSRCYSDIVVDITIVISTQETNKNALLDIRVVVFNATFNNVSVISWPSGLLVEETG